MKSWTLDIAGLLGASALLYGVWQVYPPASWITGGVLALSVSILGAKRWQS